jgi:hypothetical protein
VGESCGVVGEVGLKGVIRGVGRGCMVLVLRRALKTENGREMFCRVMCLIFGYRAEL